MVYDFRPETVMPIIQGLLTQPPQETKPAPLLPLLTEQPAVSEQPPPQEELGGTEMVNRAVAAAIPQAPNPYALNLKRDIVQAKNAYDNAKTDEQRATAQAQANFSRGLANAAGIDLSGYGADVSLADAYKNLYSQQAQDLMAALQGQYARNSERYYNDEYFRGIERGLSPRKARKVAEALAGNYKSDRAQYLDGLLNSYGRDGLVTNEYGNQIIGMLAHEDPMLASFYAGIYPNAKDAFSRYNALEDKDIAQRNALEQLAVGNEYDLGRIKAQTAGNIEYANAQHANTLQRDAIQHRYGKEDAYDQYRYSTWLARNQGEIEKEAAKLQAELNRGNLEYLKKLDVDLEDKKFWQGVAQYSKLADYFGYTGERKKAFMEAAFGIKTADPNTGKFDKASVENGKKLHEMLDNDEKNILKQIENELDPQKAAELNGKLADIRDFKQQIETLMGEQLLGTQEETAKFTGDWNKDKALIDDMREEGKRRGKSAQQIKQDIYNYMVSRGIDEKYARGAVGLD